MKRQAATAAAIALVLLVVLPRITAPRKRAGELTADPLVIPRGMYTGAPMPTQQVTLVSRRLTALQGPAGIREGASTAQNRRYFGTDVVPAPHYDRITVNRDIDLEVAALTGTQRTGGML